MFCIPSKIKSPLGRKCVYYGKRLFLLTILAILFVIELLTCVFKGQQGIVEIVMSTLIGVWLAFHMFYFYRIHIQRHIRSILEFNTEFKIEHQIQNSQNITRNCWTLMLSMCFAVFIL